MPEDKSKVSAEKSKVEEKVKVEEKTVSFEDPKPIRPKLQSSISETVQDPFCDANNPIVITFQDVCQAAFKIKGGIETTPCVVRRILKINHNRSCAMATDSTST